MLDVERVTSWQRIQLGVKDVERLIVREEYNFVMVKTRQVLEYMVRYMVERVYLVEGDLSDTIDQLYGRRWINKMIKDNYHTIRILDNKAVYEGDDTIYGTNQAYQLLAQGVYAFAGESSGGRSPARVPQTGRTASSRQTSQRQGSSSRSDAQSPQSGSRRPAQSGGQHQGDPRKRKRRRISSVSCVWRLLTSVLIVVLLITVIHTTVPSGGEDKGNLTTAPAATMAAAKLTPTLSPEPETVPGTESPVTVYRTKGSSVNVRTGPSTDSRIIVQPTNDTRVDYVKRRSNDWDMTNYDGQKAYISSRFLKKVEPVAETGTPATNGSGQNS